ncbi:hypothetical protein [Sphingomonas koreensis]|uniref:hypothetical protein n=1 Tax=Sphingomonas koreensis TaxID=93064 RepID=UPI000F7F9FC0|nr:hypothetical protein [Sphingomonas koreensis]
MRKPLLIAALAAAVAAAAFLWWRPSRSEPEAGLVAVTPVEPPRAIPSAASPAPNPSATPERPAIEADILASIPDPGAELRNVVVRRDAPQIACGEKRMTRDRAFRRFVWLGHLGMLATDDGSGAFDAVAAVCREGQPVP